MYKATSVEKNREKERETERDLFHIEIITIEKGSLAVDHRAYETRNWRPRKSRKRISLWC